MMNLALGLLRVGAPDAPALFVGPNVVTYGALRESVDALARRLLANGFRSQDRVAIVAENGIFFVVAYLGSIRAGLVAVPIPTDLSPDQAVALLAKSGATGLLVSSRYQARIERWTLPKSLRVMQENALPDWRNEPVVPLPEDGEPEALAALMFTSGSTAMPRLVKVSHRNVLANTRDIIDYVALRHDDRALLILPLFYCFGLSVLHTHLAAGASIVINNEFSYPETVLRDLVNRSCTGFAGVPSTYQILARRTRFLLEHFPALRWLQQAGGHLPAPYIDQIRATLPHVRFYVMYGQTEATARLSYLPPERLDDKIGSIGRGVPSVRMEVLRPDGSAVSPGGEIGEIVASGESISSGYCNDEEETAKYFRAGRLHTGDLAWVDADGFIFVVDRLRDFVKSGGIRIGIREIENAVASASGVAELEVIGAPHELLGEAVVVFVTAVPLAIDVARRATDHCKHALHSSRIPEAIVQVARLPRGGNGKPLRAVLRKAAEEILSSRIRVGNVQGLEVIACEFRTRERLIGASQKLARDGTESDQTDVPGS